MNLDIRIHIAEQILRCNVVRYGILSKRCIKTHHTCAHETNITGTQLAKVGT